MRGREVIAGLAGAAAMPLLAPAQRLRRTVGWLSLRSPEADTEISILAAFRQGLKETGYVEGQNLVIEFPHGEGEYDRLPALAADLVRRQVAVLVTSGGTAIARVAQAATTTIPIVFASASDPVQAGLVESMNRPGRNSTGTHLFNNALAAKRLELLRELAPNASLIGFLVNPDSATTGDQVREAQIAARASNVELLIVNARSASEIDAAFAGLVGRTSALVMGADPFFQVRQQQLVALSAHHKILTIYEWPEFVRVGGLVAYSADRVQMWRQMGVYVGRILNGANPAELPVMQPTRFELIVNLKTAKALGLRLSKAFLQLADEVIE